MSKLGIGAMLHYLSGGSKLSSKDFVGLRIVAARIDDNVLYVDFEDGQKIKLYDDGQSCCESRYMTCDDDPNTLVGYQWLSASVQEGPDAEGEYGDCHEQQFLIVQSTGGMITIANHNEHNGYYGGFGLTIERNTQ